ncbi:hypothetical protein CFP56_021083, partial [Quercus suber]
GEDGTEIAIEIKHFSHKHDLKLTDEIPNKTKCNGCVQYILVPFYSCTQCSFFLHKSSAELPKIKSNTLTLACHEHRLSLSITYIKQKCSSSNSEMYAVFRCSTCEFVLDFKCATLPQTTWYNQHEHFFNLRYTPEDDSGEY